jgi:dihydropyrimidinase
MEYLIIKNGLVITGNKVFKADVLIGNSKIVEIAKLVRRPVPGTPVIDAGGRFILPGGIDMSSHEVLQDVSNPDETMKLLSAQVISGTTTIFEAFDGKSISQMGSAASRYDELLGAANLTDYGFHYFIDDFSEVETKRLMGLFLRKGVASCTVNSNVLLEQNERILSHFFTYMTKTGQTLVVDLNVPEPAGSGYLSASLRNPSGKVDKMEVFTKLLWLLKDVTFPVLFSKLRYIDEIAAFDKFLQSNKKLHAEVDLPCLLGEKNDFLTLGQTLWNAESYGMKPILPSMFVELMGLDNYLPARPSLNLSIGNVKDSPVFNRPDKFFGIKFYTSMLYTLCVTHGNLAITDFVSCFATRPAKLLGMYPQKGILREGSDADILIWNPDFERNLYCNFAHKPDSQEYRLQGKADFVFSKGKMVFDGESFMRDNLHGAYLYRTPC